MGNWMAPGNNHVTAISTEIFKYVRIHPNFGSRPVWCEKMLLCCFCLKTTEKRLDKQAQTSTPTHPPLSLCVPEWYGVSISRVSTEERSKRREACLSSLFFLLLGENNTGTSFQITQVGSRGLVGFWHTWKFQSKWQLRGCCPEPFN